MKKVLIVLVLSSLVVSCSNKPNKYGKGKPSWLELHEHNLTMEELFIGDGIVTFDWNE